MTNTKQVRVINRGWTDSGLTSPAIIEFEDANVRFAVSSSGVPAATVAGHRVSRSQPFHESSYPGKLYFRRDAAANAVVTVTPQTAGEPIEPTPDPGETNTAPVSAATAISTPQGVAKSGQLPPATDSNGDPVTYAVGTTPAHGNVTISTLGAYTYTPAAGYNGADSFTFVVSDGMGGSNTYSVSVTVSAPANTAPAASNISISTAQDTAKSGQLPAASDIDGDAITYSLGTPAAKGTATVSGTGAYTYTPNAGYNGADSFGFTISDGKGGSNSYTVSVTVTATVQTRTTTGTAVVGSTFTAVGGTPERWMRDGLTIPGASGQTYVARDLDVGFSITWADAGGVSTPAAVVAGVGTFTDNFNRANELLSVNPLWRVAGAEPNTFNVDANRLKTTGTVSTGTAARTPNLGSTNHAVQFVISAGVTSNFVAVRMVDENNFVGVRYDPSVTGLQLFTRISGTLAQVGTTYTIPSPKDGDVVRMEVVGTQVTVKLNGTAVIGPIAVTAHSNCAHAGVLSRQVTGNVASLDDFVAEALMPVRAPTKTPSGLIFAGDSLTDGQGASTGNTGARDAVTGKKDYPSQLYDLLGGKYLVRNAGVAGNTSTQIMARLRDDSTYYGRTVGIWAGRNNYTAPTTVKADIASMVTQAIKFSEGRFFIMSILHRMDGTEDKGSSIYNAVETLNSELKALYPNNFVDISRILIDAGAPGGAYPDAAAFARDVMPAAIISDGLLHLNDAGYALVAGAVKSFLASKGWLI